MTEPEDLKSLLDGIIDIVRGTRELQALYTQFQATPTKASLKSLRDKDCELESLLEFYEDCLEIDSDFVFDESEWDVTVVNST